MSEDTSDAIAGIMIQLSRIYDLLALQLDDELRDKVVAMHESGGLISGPPIINEETWKAWQEE